MLYMLKISFLWKKLWKEKQYLWGKKRYPPKSQILGMDMHYKIYFKTFGKSNQNTYFIQRPFQNSFKWIQKGDLVGDCSGSYHGELALGQNVLVGYMSWEGFNFEDGVIINEKVISKYISLHIEKYDLEIRETFHGLEKITRSIPGLNPQEMEKLDKNGIIQIGSWVEEGEILVGKIIPVPSRILFTHEKLLYDIVGEKTFKVQEKCLRVPQGVSGRIIRISYTLLNRPTAVDLKKISLYIAEKKKFQVGDKISGRHGNKGIISKILSNCDMPYLSNGWTLDVLLNPLGVPSRMNVGQIFECLLGLVGQISFTKFKVLCFDETYGYEASRSFIYSKLFQLSQNIYSKNLLSKKTPGKLKLFDGRTGQLFSQPILVGSTYLMKLIHIVDEKIHARSTGPYSLITQQPLRGRSKHGGQRLGEMEVWALQGFGSAYALQELLTVKSDDLYGRNQIMQTLFKNMPLQFGTPESLRVVIRELQCLCLDLQFTTFY
uniref:DNA-directed RNA polymerase n=1 Tax=Tydemania expeditionis TaxID=325645 RepID=A0A0D6E278_TYDEX|nr:RNA polymerase beta subunit [Tydemania expeditionis]CEO91095.1 RNA polymerase beta subunit [Tydemania expeditionis]